MRSIWNDVEKVFAMPPVIAAAAKDVEQQEREDLVRRDEAALARRARPAGPRRRPARRRGRSRSAHDALAAAGRGSRAIGSGWTPPKSGSRAVRKPTHARARRPARISGRSVPAAPCIASARTESRDARIAARSTSEARRSR